MATSLQSAIKNPLSCGIELLVHCNKKSDLCYLSASYNQISFKASGIPTSSKRILNATVFIDSEKAEGSRKKITQMLGKLRKAKESGSGSCTLRGGCLMIRTSAAH